MKCILFISAILLLAACTNPPAKQEDPNSWTVNEYNKDGLRIDITNHKLKNFSIHISRKNDSLTLDLNELHIPFKTPEVTWVNKDFFVFQLGGLVRNHAIYSYRLVRN
jgi:hypothetical protein